MRPFLAVARLDNPAAEPFVVISVDPTQREGNGCKAIVMSVHWTEGEAEEAIAKANGQ